MATPQQAGGNGLPKEGYKDLCEVGLRRGDDVGLGLWGSGFRVYKIFSQFKLIGLILQRVQDLECFGPKP